MPMPLSSFIALILLFTLSIAHNRRDGDVVIFNESNKYDYYGCYNETVQVADSAQSRALDGGANLIKKGTMTAKMCLDFCQKSGGIEYAYAGLEWSRECWCSQRISGLSEKLNDAECSYPCEGNSSQVCGGSLKLSVYTLSKDKKKDSSGMALQIPGLSALIIAASVGLRMW